MSTSSRLLLLALATWALACSTPTVETDPLASLSAPEPSATFTADYWYEQASNATITWREAVALCQQDGHRMLPNCETVAQVRFLRSLRDAAQRKSGPYDGQNDIPFPDLIVRTMETGTDPLPPKE